MHKHGEVEAKGKSAGGAEGKRSDNGERRRAMRGMMRLIAWQRSRRGKPHRAKCAGVWLPLPQRLAQPVCDSVCMFGPVSVLNVTCSCGVSGVSNPPPPAHCPRQAFRSGACVASI